MARTSFGIAVGIAAGFAFFLGLAAITLMFVNDDSLADFGD
jgi:hypothetical protein